MRFDPGSPVSVRVTKWGGGRHWEYEGVYLGVDEHGDWLGFPAGTHCARPAKSFDAQWAWVSLVPRHDAAHFASFNAEGHHEAIYVDMTTPPEWGGDVLRMIDLDLDVILLREERRLLLDDQDEFEEHQLAYGYPPEIISLAEDSAERVLAAVEAGEPPYDGSAERWLAELERLTAQ